MVLRQEAGAQRDPDSQILALSAVKISAGDINHDEKGPRPGPGQGFWASNLRCSRKQHWTNQVEFTSYSLCNHLSIKQVRSRERDRPQCLE